MRHLLVILFLSISFLAAAQQNAPNIGCKDATILVQANELKESLVKQGFEVVNDAMLSMESREDFPIVVRMQEGVFYQITFIGNTRSKRMNLDLFAPNSGLIIKKEQQPLNQTSNVISFSFSPSESGDYRFNLSQTMKQELLKFKGKDIICGSFCILRLKKTNP